MTHDFNTAVVDLHGVNQTIRVEKPFGGKNIDVLCDLFADSVETGKPQFPLTVHARFGHCIRICVDILERHTQTRFARYW